MGVLSEAEIARLVRGLGSDEYATREWASSRLRNREEAEPSLRAACRNRDLEVRRRAERLLGDLRAYRLGRLRRLLAAGRVDSFVEQAVTWPEAESESWLWLAALTFARNAVEHISQQPVPVYKRLLDTDLLWGSDRGSFPALDAYLVHPRVARLRGDSVCVGFSQGQLVRAGRVSIGRTPLGGLFLVSGDLATHQVSRACGSIFLVNGRAEFNDSLFRCLVVCAGDVVFHSSVHESLVIASGKVVAPNGAVSSVVLGASSIDCPKRFEACSVIRPHCAGPMARVNFLGPSRLGAELKAEEGRLRLRQVKPGGPFARGGARKGDLVEAIGGKPVSTVQEAYRQFRRFDGCPRPVRLRVRRGETVLDLSLTLGS